MESWEGVKSVFQFKYASAFAQKLEFVRVVKCSLEYFWEYQTSKGPTVCIIMDIDMMRFGDLGMVSWISKSFEGVPCLFFCGYLVVLWA